MDVRGKDGTGLCGFPAQERSTVDGIPSSKHEVVFMSSLVVFQSEEVRRVHPVHLFFQDRQGYFLLCFLGTA